MEEDIKKMKSKTLTQMEKTKKGYRNEDFRGSGEVDFESIANFEIMELGNLDIPEFLMECGMKDILKDVQVDPFFDPNPSQEEYIIKEIMKFVRLQLKVEEDVNLYAKWLTSREGVLESYVLEDDWTISQYTLPDSFLAVSDIGEEGALFVSPCKFEDSKIVSTLWKGVTRDEI